MIKDFLEGLIGLLSFRSWSWLLKLLLIVLILDYF